MAAPTAVISTSKHPIIEIDSLWCNNKAQANMAFDAGDHAFLVSGCFPCPDSNFSSSAIREVIIVGRCRKYSKCRGFSCYYISPTKKPSLTHTCGQYLTDTLPSAKDNAQQINYQALNRLLKRKLKLEETIKNVENICINATSVNVRYDNDDYDGDDECCDAPEEEDNGI